MGSIRFADQFKKVTSLKETTGKNNIQDESGDEFGDD